MNLGLAGRLLLSALLAACLAGPGRAGTSNSLLDISADGELLACSNRDSGTVSVIRLKGRDKLHEVKVGKEPEGISFVGATHTLAVAVYAEDRLAFVDADAGKVIASL